MTSKLKSQTNLDRNAWLDHTLSILQAEGIQGIRVERLARDLGVTKGSFYWHFTDRDDLFNSLLEFWVQQFNDVITKNPRFLQADPETGLLEAMKRVRQQGLDRYELAMRSWADHDPRALKVVREIYLQRKKFVRGFFTRLGFRGMDADARTRLALCYLSWEPNMLEEESSSRSLAQLKGVHQLLTKRQG